MKRALLFSFLTLLACAALRAAETDNEVEAHKVALELAGAFSNDGFKIRDGHWSGEVKKGAPELVAVNLYAGNQYWFSVGAQGAKDFAVHVYDESGQPMTTEDFDDGDKAAAGFSPTVSGQYFVSIHPGENESGTYCLLYSYK